MRVGCVVRVPLNGRKVKGWVVARSDDPTSPPNHAEPFHTGELQQIIDVRGNGVAGDLIETALWCSQSWSGPLRAVLVAASAPRLRDLAGTPQYRLVPRDRVSSVGIGESRQSDPPAVALHVAPPHRPVISLALEAAADGPVLLLCPTVDMAARGAAWLRRQGAVVAEYPQEWSRACGGVDVVIGPRSAAWSPVPGLATVIVVDEHDSVHVNERAPHWDATRVAQHRASAVGARVILSSPVPSLARVAELDAGTASLHGDSERAGWGDVDLVDLTDDRQHGGVPSTLISASMLEICRDESARIGVVLNSRDESQTVTCSSCGSHVTCSACGSPMTRGSRDILVCSACGVECAAICTGCGSTKLRAARVGFKGLASALRKALRREVGVVSATDDSPAPGAGVFVGTEALVHRVHPLDVVIVADADAWLGSARLGAAERLWAVSVRALRAGAGAGRLVLQSRHLDRPALRAIAATGHSGVDAYLTWARDELAVRRELSLPPFVHSALVSPPDGSSSESLRTMIGRADLDVRTAPTPDGILVLADERRALDACIASVRAEAPRSRIIVEPRDL